VPIRLTTLVAALSLTCYGLSFIAPSTAQSLDPKNPAVLPQGITRATIDSFGHEQFWTFTTGPGHFHLAFTRSDPKEGFTTGPNAGIGAIINPKVVGSTMTFKEGPQGTVYEGDAKSNTRVVIMIEPPKSALVRQTCDYTLTLEGQITSAGGSDSAAPAQEPSVVGVYNMFMGDAGAAKFKADGTISTTSGANGTWELFDQGTETYVIILGGKRLTLTYQPGRGFIDNNNILVLQRKP
jgi:hypothetical protein